MFEESTQKGQAPQSQANVIPQPTVMPASSATGASPAAQEPTDMFAGVDAGISAPSAPQEYSQGQSAGAGYTFEEEEPKQWYMQKKFIIIILGVVLALIIVIFGAQFAMKFFAPAGTTSQPSSSLSDEARFRIDPAPIAPITPEATQPQETIQATPEATVPQEGPPVGEQSIPSAEQTVPTQQPTAGEIDTDADGLLDSEEQAIGTNTALTDTDGDGLSDREEFRVFGTDPLNTDTDGDSYLDGAEVQNGYNPKGEGKLFTIPTE